MAFANYLVILVVGLAVVAISCIVFAWVFARQYCKPERRQPKKTPADYDLPFEPISFTSRGVQLSGWFVPNGNGATQRPPIVVVHGWSSNAAQMLPVAQALQQAGFDVLLYDARGHGTSDNDGPITIRKFAEDLIAAIDYLAERSDANVTRVGVVAHSLGASGAILATTMDPRIQALVSSSAFADPVNLTRRAMQFAHVPRGPCLWLVCRFIDHWLGISMVKIAPQNRISQITAPVLLIHGEADPYVLPSDMETLYERANPTLTQRWLVPRRHHLNVILDPGFGPRVVEFLSEHL